MALKEQFYHLDGSLVVAARQDPIAATVEAVLMTDNGAVVLVMQLDTAVKLDSDSISCGSMSRRALDRSRTWP